MRSFIGSISTIPPLSNIGKEIVKEPWRMKLAYGNVCYSSLLLSPQGAQALRIVTTMGDLFRSKLFSTDSLKNLYSCNSLFTLR